MILNGENSHIYKGPIRWSSTDSVTYIRNIGWGMPSDHFVCDHVIMALTIQHHHRSGLHQAVGRAARVGSCVSHARVFHPERALYCFGFHGDWKLDADTPFDITLKFFTIFKPVNIIRNKVHSCSIAGNLERFVRVNMLPIRDVDDCKIEDKDRLHDSSVLTSHKTRSCA